MTNVKTPESSPTPPTIPEVERTSSDIPVQPLYTPADLAQSNYDRDIGYPGDFPYTRGVQATTYRGRLWTMRQYAGMGDAEESNKRYKYLLANGTTGLSVAFDLPTQIGLDSDNPLAMGEVGKVGVAIDSIEDMQRLFDGIDLTAISTSMPQLRFCWRYMWPSRGGRPRMAIKTFANFPAPSRTTSSRNTSPAELISTRHSRQCVSSPTFSPGRTNTSPSGTRFLFPAITCARTDRPPCRKSPSP